MRSGWLLAFLAVFLLGAQDGRKRRRRERDQTRGKPPSRVLQLGVSKTARLKGFHIDVKTRGAKFEGSYQGIAKKDAAAVKGSAEIYAKGALSLVRDGNSFVDPKTLDIQSDKAKAALAFRNPWISFGEMQQAAAAARFLEDEKVDGIDCRVVEAALNVEQKKAALQGFLRGIKLPVDPFQFIDLDKSTAVYKVWIGRKDLRIHKYTFELKPVTKGNLPPIGRGGGGGLPSPEDLEGFSTVRLTRFEEDLDWEIPNEVRRRLGIR